MSLHEEERIRARLADISDPTSFLIDLFASAPVGLAVWDLSGHVVLTNQAFFEIFRSEPPPGYSVLDDEHLVRTGTRAFVDRAYAGETVRLPIFWYDPREDKRFDITEGRRVAISLTLFPLRGASGSIEHVVAMYQDETERVIEAERLQRCEERYRLAEQAGSFGTFDWDAESGISAWTPELEKFYGLSGGESKLTQESWTNLVHPDDRASISAAVERAFATNEVVEGEWRIVGKDGTTRWVVARFLSPPGSRRRLIGVNVDITERKTAETQRAAVMEAALDAIVMMDEAGNITDFNPAAERTFGYARKEVLGRPLADVIIPAAKRESHRAGLRRFVETGVGPFVGNRIETVAIRRDESEFPVEIAIVQVRSLKESFFTGYIRDITERRRAEEAELLRRENEATRAANRELEAFSYSVAHDLRAPLRGINGFATILGEDYAAVLDAEGLRHLQRIVGAGRRMGEIIDSLLALARVSRTALRLADEDLAPLAKSIIEQFQQREPERHVELVCDESMVVRADPSLLRIVLENLLGNAWKFTREQKPARIEVGRSTVDGEVRYFVRDNGAGFDMAYSSQLFKAFKRLHSTAQFEGTGVGLATVQRIVERHGGRIWAEAKENEGATFFFTLTPKKG